MYPGRLCPGLIEASSAKLKIRNWPGTHVKRMDGGGIDYLELWVSGDQVSAGRSVGKPNFTFTLTPDGHPQGKRPGGYEYAWVIAGE